MNDMVLLIAGMTAVTYMPRVLPMLLLSSRAVPEWLNRWLYMVAPAIFGALLLPSLVHVYKKDVVSLEMVWDPTFLLAALPAFLAGWFCKSFIATIAAGMAATALLRFWAA